MIEELNTLANQAAPSFWVAMLVFIRVGTMMALVPAFGEQSVPVRVRLAIAIAFSLVVFPAVQDKLNTEPSQILAMARILGGEVLIGLFLGILMRLFVLVLSIAGAIAAQSTSLSQIFGGSAGIEPAPAIGHLLVISGLALATVLGLHVRIAELMINSYEFLPVGLPLRSDLVGEVGVNQIAKAFGFAFTLAAPFVVASVIYNVTLGVINKAMPQLMVSFVGAPVITAGGLILLFFSAPTLLGIWVESLNGFLANPIGTF